MNRKQRLIRALKELPDTATLDDIEDRFWFVMKIERGLADMEAGKGISHEEVVKYFVDRFGFPVHEHEEMRLD